MFLKYLRILARHGIQMDPLVNERRWQSGKKPVLCMLGLLPTIVSGREWFDQESVNHEKIALAHKHNWAPITSTSTREVARTSARRLGHPAGFFLDFFSLPPTLILQGRPIAPFFVCRVCSCSDLLVRISGLFCVRDVLRIFIDQKMSNLSALLVLSPVDM